MSVSHNPRKGIKSILDMLTAEYHSQCQCFPYYSSTAPCFNNNCATASCSLDLAAWKAVQLLLKLLARICTSAPCASSIRTTSRCPRSDAVYNAVRLRYVVCALTSAPRSKRNCTTFACPSLDAQYNDDQPVSSPELYRPHD